MRVGDFGDLKSRLEYSYTSKQYFSAFNEVIAKQDAYSVVNAIFTFKPDDSNLSFKVFGRNILNKPYVIGKATTSIAFFSRAQWAPPRTFGAEVTAKF